MKIGNYYLEFYSPRLTCLIHDLNYMSETNQNGLMSYAWSFIKANKHMVVLPSFDFFKDCPRESHRTNQACITQCWACNKNH